jgi:hypothetical protein
LSPRDERPRIGRAGRPPDKEETMSLSKLTKSLVFFAVIAAALTVEASGIAAVRPSGSALVAKKATIAYRPYRPVLTIPAFKIEATRLYAADESGYDWAGSDEPMVVFTSATASGSPYTSSTPEFSDVDSGDSRSLNNLCVIASCANGFTQPIALTMQLFEIDQGNPDEVRERVEQAATAIEWAAVLFGSSKQELPAWFIDYVTGLLGNDLMGSKTVTFDPQVLAQQLPQVGNSMTVGYHLGGNSGDLPWEVAGGPDYDLSIRITRLQNQSLVRTVNGGLVKATTTP